MFQNTGKPILVVVPTRMVHVMSGDWEDALISKEKAKNVKDLEDKYNTKILENGVSTVYKKSM